MNDKGFRLIGFGRYAGIVGAYNGFRTWGLKFNTFNLPKAEPLPDQQALISELNKITKNPINSTDNSGVFMFFSFFYVLN